MTDAAWGSGRRRTEAFPADLLLVNLTLVERAAETGAFCLDGSLPAYSLDRGYGSGANNWLLQLQSGGWCNDRESCIARKTTFKGSSNYMDKQGVFSGILSNKRCENPAVSQNLSDLLKNTGIKLSTLGHHISGFAVLVSVNVKPKKLCLACLQEDVPSKKFVAIITGSQVLSSWDKGPHKYLGTRLSLNYGKKFR
ncbi:hypothetical protein SUGI_0853180 [Cryptomeria japonica]|nr:hypothetical protein SUGI_0853180 [Cryptomeria japonica]